MFNWKIFYSLLGAIAAVQYNDLEFDQEVLEAKRKNVNLAVFSFDFRGLGWNLFNMIRHKIYYADLGRDFAVNDSSDKYKYQGKGVMKQFFSPSFPLLEQRAGFPVKLSTTEEEEKQYPIISIRPMMRSRTIVEKYLNKVDAYKWLCDEACKHLQFSEEGRELMEKYRRSHGVPDFTRHVSVAFHVRRGDKLLNEDRKYEADEYVEKLKSLHIREKIKYCFVASDDYIVAAEMREALLRGKIPCRVYSLVQSEQHGNQQESRKDEEVLQFMTELSIMVDATYFIGSFGSNIGGLSAVLRSCYRTDKSNHSNTYGVDKEDFNWIY